MTLREYRPDIDGLRSVAVLAVLLFHLDVDAFSGGYVGVDVFFVISGFLITRLILAELVETGSFSFPHFYLRRLRRLGPALLLTLLATTIAAVLLFAPADLQRYGGGMLHAVLSLSNIYFWSQAGYFEAGTEFNALLHTWSLSVEEQFYLLWPIALVALFTAWGGKRAFRVLLVIVGTSFLLNLAFDGHVLDFTFPQMSNDTRENLDAALFFLTPFRVFELGIGAIVVFIIDRRIAWRHADELLLALGILMIAYAVVFFTDDITFPSYNALLPCVGAALVIYARNPKLLGLLLRNKLAVGIGLISYSLYLVHWPVIVFAKYWSLSPLTAREQIAIALASIAIAAAMYGLIEQPFRRGASLAGAKNARFVAASGFLALLLVVTAANAWANNGWLWRLDGNAQAIFANFADPREFHRTYYGGAICKPSDNCIVNRGKGPNVFFVGDSHSQQYASGLVAAFPDFQFTHLDSRCRFNTLDMCYAGKYQDSKYVLEKIEQFRFLKQSTDKVIIGQAWFDRRSHYDPKTGTFHSFETTEQYVHFLVRELQRVDEYLGHGRIMVTGEVNRFGDVGDPLACIGRPLAGDSCTLSKKSFAFEFNQLLGAALKEAEIPFISPTDALCDGRGCLNMIGKRPVYSDSGHLSVWGSKFVVQRTRVQFARFLGASAGP